MAATAIKSSVLSEDRYFVTPEIPVFRPNVPPETRKELSTERCISRWSDRVSFMSDPVSNVRFVRYNLSSADSTNYRS